MLTREQAAQFAGRFHIDSLTVVREYLQVLFLAGLSRQPGALHWYFKGGTAIRLLGNSFRFSEDLDFTVTTTAPRAMQLAGKIVLAMQEEVPEIAFRSVQGLPGTVAGQLRYTPPNFKYPLVIRLQCSLREHPRRPKTSLLETEYPIPYPWIQHLDWPEILAEKVRALLVRGKGRDLFDLWFLLTKKVPLEWPLIRAKMALYHRSVAKEDLMSAIERMDSTKLLRDMGPFLPREHRRLPGELRSRVLELI